MKLIDDKETLDRLSRDQSICKITPKGLVEPNSVEELCEIVKETKTSLTARAGGTCMSGGPLSEGVIVSVSKLSNILSFDEVHQTLWVEGGTWYRDIETFLLEKNRMFAPYTSSKDICSIGGMVGNNASGEKSVRYGATRDNVRSVRMILADGNEYAFGPLSSKAFEEKKKLETLEGEIYRKLEALLLTNNALLKKELPSTKKNTAGYALTHIFDEEKNEWNIAKLIVGSQGTLGIISAVELHTVPIKKHHALYALPIDSFENVPDILEDVEKGDPESIEVYDQTTLRLSCKEDPVIKKNLEHLLSSKAVLLIEYGEETEEELVAKQKIFTNTCAKNGISFEFVEDPEVQRCHWDTRRKSYGLFKANTVTGTPVPIIEDISIHKAGLDTLFDEIEEVMEKFGYEYVFHGHIGDASIRVFPIIDFSKENAKENLVLMAKEVFSLVLEKNGTISTDHGDGIVRTPFLPMMYPENIMAIFQEVKNIFDPKNIFNPGKKLSISMEYFKDHIVTE